MFKVLFAKGQSKNPLVVRNMPVYYCPEAEKKKRKKAKRPGKKPNFHTGTGNGYPRAKLPYFL